MKPFPHDLNLGYGLCKCKNCKQRKAQRTNHNTAVRMKAKAEIKKEVESITKAKHTKPPLDGMKAEGKI